MSSPSSPVMVSVITLAYNQERYMAEALESIVSQECDFAFECIVADDRSTDRTPEIIREYQERYPGIIKPILRDANVGARHNLAGALSACQGRYVAILDGDDRWTSPHKLATQVAYMERHQGCSVSCHGVTAIDIDGRPADVELPAGLPELQRIEDLLRENFISTCTVMYRWGLVPQLPKWWDETWVSDYVLHVLHADRGWIGYIDEVMAEYRIHDQGMWSGQRAAERMDEFIKTLKLLDQELGMRYHDVIERSIYAHAYNEFNVRFRVASEMHFKGTPRLARPHVLWMLRHLNRRGTQPLNAIVVLTVSATVPWLVKPLVAAKAALGRVRGRGDAGPADGRDS